MSKISVIRHGEILFVERQEIPKEAKFKKTNTLLIGSGQNPHTFKGGRFYELNRGIIFGYFEAKNTKLFHKEHSPKGVSVKDGVYELRKGQEYVNGELKQIID